MLIFWNFAGVPFSYCYSTLYLLNRSLANNPVHHSKMYTVSLYIILLAAYYVWDTANSQKNRFRMQQRGTFVERKTFPQLPWGTINNPTYILTKHGNKLLTAGWFGVARKIREFGGFKVLHYHFVVGITYLTFLFLSATPPSLLL